MSSNKPQKWSSSSSLSKFFCRISRTLSFTSKKSQQTLKNNNKKVKPIEPVIKNINFVPQSVPIIRRHPPPQPISKMLYTENSTKQNNYRPVVYQNMYVENDIDEEDHDDLWRYSLQPDLSLFNISAENLNYQSQENYQQIKRQNDWLEEIFHSTKIEDY